LSFQENSVPLSYFNKAYFSKEDIKTAVSSYSEICRKNFQIVKSDKRRYYVKCIDDNCSFKLRFNFSCNNYSPPTVREPHNCETQTISCDLSVHSLVNNPDVQSWFSCNGRNASVKGLRSMIAAKGLDLPYHTLKRCLQNLRKDFFKADTEQDKLLDSYVTLLNTKGHFAVLEVDDTNSFQRKLHLPVPIKNSRPRCENCKIHYGHDKNNKSNMKCISCGIF